MKKSQEQNTHQIKLFGVPNSPEAYAIRDFLNEAWWLLNG